MKTALITGANRGLGYGFVQHLLSDGYLVFAGTRVLDSSLPKKVNLVWVQLDVTDDSSIASARKIIGSRISSLNLLINNAGISKKTVGVGQADTVVKLESLDRSNLLKMFNVNAVSPLMVIKQFKDLIEAASGFIINISSCRASFHDEEENTNANYGYRASKLALNMITHASLHDLPPNVKTFAVHPGYVRSDMSPQGTEDPIVQAERIISITRNWKDDFNGAFLRYDGTFYPL